MTWRRVLFVLDMQNDICHRDGVFHKHGLIAPQIEEIIPPICELIQQCRRNHIPVLATQLTISLFPGQGIIGCSALKRLYPFLEKEGLRENTWGHDLVEGLPPVDCKIRKFGISAFYQTELTHFLEGLNAKELILCGFTTNGVVETFAREAISRNYHVITLINSVTSYSKALHEASLPNLSVMGPIMTSQQWLKSHQPAEA